MLTQATSYILFAKRYLFVQGFYTFLPTDQLPVHGVLLISASKGHPSSDHGPDYIHQPRQATYGRNPPSVPR